MAWPGSDISIVKFLTGKRSYVSGEVHINGIEGFWGLSKMNMGTYKGIKKKNWKYYLKEMEFPYNYRRLIFSEQVSIKLLRH